MASWPYAGDAATAARNRLLPEGRVAGPMPWVIAIMMFLTVLSGAAGLGLSAATRALGSEMAGRATVQLVEADAELRRQTVDRLLVTLRGAPQVRAVQPVDDKVLAEQLRPWLGEDMEGAELPIPALIDVTLADGDRAGQVERLRRLVTGIAPNARVEAHAAFLAPLSRLIASLTWLSAALVALMAIATGSVVVLAARGAHDSHRGTIEILHLMGATDVQIARLFQRRIALDALFGGALGFVLAALVILLISRRLDATGSELMEAVSLPPLSWLLLLLLPAIGVAVATLTARFTVLRALGRQL